MIVALLSKVLTESHEVSFKRTRRKQVERTNEQCTLTIKYLGLDWRFLRSCMVVISLKSSSQRALRKKIAGLFVLITASDGASMSQDNKRSEKI